MPIEVELPDGLIAEFPDGTSNATMEMALSRYRQTKSGPNFGNVQTSSGSTERARAPRQPTPKRTAAQLTGISDEMMNPAYQQPVGLGTKLLRTVMPLSDPNFRAGIGKSFADGYRGLKQLGTEAAMVQTGLTAGLMNRMGLDGNALVRNQGFPLQDARNQMMQDTADTRESDAPLMGTTAGLLGNATGTAAQFLGPGMALRGTTAARAFLPATIGGNAAQGAAMGAIQPYSSDGDRMANTALGGIGGAVGAGIPATLGAGIRQFSGQGASRVEKQAGRAMLGALQGRPFNTTTSATPGVQLPLGESTLDPGLMRLEDSLRTNPETGPLFSVLDLNNNEARVGELQRIGGDFSQMTQAKRARDAAAGPLYAQAFAATVPVDPALQATLNRLPNSVINTARRLAKMEGAQLPKDATEMTGQQLHYVKLALDNALSKTGPGGLGNVEKRLLTQAKEALVTRISTAIPEYGQAMGQYTAMSAPINRMQLGQEFLSRVRAPQDDALGNPLLQPGKFGTTMRNIDEIAQDATGMSNATGRSILPDADFNVLNSIDDDLRRQSVRMTTPGGGARTAARLLSEQSLSGRLGVNTLAGYLSRSVPVMGGVADWWQDRTTRKALDEMAKLFTSNPQEAQRVLMALAPTQRREVESALIALGGRTGVVGSTLTE